MENLNSQYGNEETSDVLVIGTIEQTCIAFIRSILLLHLCKMGQQYFLIKMMNGLNFSKKTIILIELSTPNSTFYYKEAT